MGTQGRPGRLQKTSKGSEMKGLERAYAHPRQAHVNEVHQPQETRTPWGFFMCIRGRAFFNVTDC